MSSQRIRRLLEPKRVASDSVCYLHQHKFQTNICHATTDMEAAIGPKTVIVRVRAPALQEQGKSPHRRDFLRNILLRLRRRLQLEHDCISVRVGPRRPASAIGRCETLVWRTLISANL